MTKKRILFFSPHAAIWVHAFPEALLAETLQKSGHPVSQVACGEVYRDYCVAMSAFNLKAEASLAERQAICDLCQFRARMLQNNLDLHGPVLAGVLDAADWAWVEAEHRRLPRQGFVDHQVDGFPLGRLALYVVLLHLKKIDIELTDEEWQPYRVEFRNALISLAAIKKLVLQERPDRAVFYNTMYPVNRICYEYLESAGIPSYSIHAGSNLAHRLQYLFLTRHTNFHFFKQQIAAFAHYQDLPCSEREVSLVVDHFQTLLQGTSHWAYSAARQEGQVDLRERFGIPPGKKVLVATMSSYDERFAAETVGAVQDPPGGLLFPRQVDWIQEIIEYVQDRPELFLIVRVHPREFRAAISQHAQELQARLRDLPANVRVNWPSDEVSIYDLAEITDLFLNAWSTAGKEMTFLGIPVLIYSADLPLYPASLNYLGDRSREHYFAQLEQALVDGWQPERIVQAFRWYAFEQIRSLFDLSESYPAPEADPARSEVRRQLGAWIPGAEERLDCHGRAGLLRQTDLLSQVLEQGADSLLACQDPLRYQTVDADQETRSIRRQYRRLLDTWRPGAGGAEGEGLFARLFAFSAE